MSASKDTIFLGEVSSVQPYGAFVKIPGCASQGLVHRSQISKANVPEVSEVLSKGDRVWCKVISTDDGKIGLSMKVVDQGSGRDLDPNGVQMQLDEQRRKEWVPGGKQKTISLEAVYNTTCSKCGTRGHLGKDCFQVAGGKTYELIPEEDSVKPRPPPTENTVDLDPLNEKNEKKRRKKEAKKEKKEAKKKKKAAKKLKKKLKKEAKKARKQKKKKQQSSSDSNESEDTSSSSSSSSGSESGSEDESHLKEKAQRKGLAANCSETRRRRTRSRSPVRESKKQRNDTSSSRERETRESSLDRRRRTRR